MNNKKTKNRPSGLKYKIVSRNKGWFKNGSSGFNGEHSKETKNLISQKLLGNTNGVDTRFKKNQIPWNLGKTHMVDEKHPKWKGDGVGYNALHTWIQRKLGKPDTCEFCGKISDRHTWANKSGKYLRDLNDWLRLCYSCHKKYDLYK